MSISITGNQYPRPDDTGSGEPAAKAAPAVPISITNTVKLKEAELKGEYYTLSDEQFVKSIERAIKAIQGKTTTLEFGVHEQTKSITVKVLDKETGEVIREVPPEKTLDFVAKMMEMAGIIIDERR
ncbi:flagellar protein FlaG [Paenibacillus sp. UNCCL117]|uniref:flagellar protein FlaG n=1 Tax=unclassified Paenibacillus TaxID=185978 RepID=UPI00088A6EBE|nr:MULTISPECIES: flagellar protein FlaG [unclassified Paenibacillus]SDE50366.1 flagellar protein FlaG [Paenibacillus sp. cl123]SFW67375.1 flagellar protein FlaG [Paenibacillus sp. UNCCL117]